MLKYFKNKNWQDMVKILSVLFVAVVLLWTTTSANMELEELSFAGEPWDAEFVQIVDGKEVLLSDLTEYEEVAVGESLILETVIDDLDRPRILLFYSKDVEVNIFIDDENVYSFLCDEKFEFLKTPGTRWNFIELGADSSGKTLRMEFTSAFDNRFESTMSSMYYIFPDDGLSAILQKDGFRLAMSVVMVAMALFAYINAAIWERPRTRNYFYRLGNLYFATSLWLCSMCGIVNFITHKPIFSYVLSMIMAVFIPVAVYELAKVIYPVKSKIITALGYVVWGNFILQMILQFIFKISLMDMLPMLYVVYGVGSILFGLLIFQNLIAHKKDAEFALVSMTILCIGGFVEIVVLLVAPERTDLIGVGSILGMAVYLVVNQFHIIYRESRIDIEKQALEQDYNYLQSTTLMLQIKAHFFFNTLNTISALCKVNPKEADRGILLFASYMRSYMKLINQCENISFEEELEIVEATLAIEKLRFPDGFVYEFDIEFQDFKIPPMSIQPLVENSLAHGIRTLGGDGKIVLSAKRVDDFVEVVVKDNGLGFDTSILPEKKSVGLTNLEKRVKLMANGTVEIKSVIGKGTKTTLRIPLVK